VKILVTHSIEGIGRATCAALAARGDQVRALVPAGTGDAARAALKRAGATPVEGDVGDEGSLADAVRGMDTVVHTAQRSPFGGTLAEHERANLISTENALAASRAAGVRRFVFLSTEVVTAGDFDRPYVDETLPHADVFVSPYAETMALAEALVLATSGSDGMATVALRPGWVWGPGETVFLPEWIRRQRAGTLITIGSGTQFVPTTYITNLADALALATTAPAAAGNVYYVTDDERIGCRAFLTHVLGAVGLGGPRGRVPYRLAYARAWLGEQLGIPTSLRRADVVAYGRAAYFNLGRAREELGYAPAVSIAEGLKKLGVWAQHVGGADAIARGALTS
jgi:nucleoside-diphosphate-sugar epimerase